MIDRPVCLLGVPMDLGGGLRGVDMGPSAIRIAGLQERVEALGVEFHDLGNVPVSRPESRKPKDPKARFLHEIARCCNRLRARVEGVLEDGAFPVVIGGDHSIACGTVAAISTFHARRNEKIGLLWFDSHGDMNTPEITQSGNIHGMPLASILGHGPDELTRLGERFPMVDVERSVLIGAHDVDDGERAFIKEVGLKVFSVREVDMLGMHETLRQALKIVTQGTAGFHLSFDIDGCDPSVAPGVGTPVRGGMTERESHLVMEHAAESGKMLGLEITEINPILDHRNRTAEFAAHLVESALGKLVI